LRETISAYGGAGADADQPEAVRFLRGVAQVVRRRLRRGDEAALAPAVFLMCPMPPENLDKEAIEYHPMLDNGLTPVEGRIWLVGPVVLSGKSLPLEASDDGAMFEVVIGSLDRGDVPAVIYDPRADPAQLRFYANGLRNADTCDVIDILMDVMDLKRILSVVDRACENHLVTPDAQDPVAKLWEDADRHWVKRDAELRIQMYLVTSFSAAFPTYKIRKEQPQTTGRLDIEIEEPDYVHSGHFIRHAVLELKVLRSFGDNGGVYTVAATKRWVAEGVEQAYAYRLDRKSLQSALFCFDMRKSHDDASAFTEVEEKARNLDVTVRHWLLYASAKEYRADISALAAVKVEQVDLGRIDS
jgi:hypothetical protein